MALKTTSTRPSAATTWVEVVVHGLFVEGVQLACARYLAVA